MVSPLRLAAQGRVQSRPGRPGQANPRTDARHRPAAAARSYHVTYGILTADEAAAFSIIPNGILGAKLATAYNDWLLEKWLQEDARLRGLIVVAAQHPEAAAAEIRRHAGDDRWVGVFLPGGARVPYGNVIYDPIWKAAAECGFPVAVHTHFDGVGISPPTHLRRAPRHLRRVPRVVRIGHVPGISPRRCCRGYLNGFRAQRWS